MKPEQVKNYSGRKFRVVFEGIADDGDLRLEVETGAYDYLEQHLLAKYAVSIELLPEPVLDEPTGLGAVVAFEDSETRTEFVRWTRSIGDSVYDSEYVWIRVKDGRSSCWENILAATNKAELTKPLYVVSPGVEA